MFVLTDFNWWFSDKLLDRANDTYYDKKITLGNAEPDIHGTVMFVWGIALIDYMLKLGLNWKIPLN